MSIKEATAKVSHCSSDPFCPKQLHLPSACQQRLNVCNCVASQTGRHMSCVDMHPTCQCTYSCAYFYLTRQSIRVSKNKYQIFWWEINNWIGTFVHAIIVGVLFLASFCLDISHSSHTNLFGQHGFVPAVFRGVFLHVFDFECSVSLFICLSGVCFLLWLISIRWSLQLKKAKSSRIL